MAKETGAGAAPARAVPRLQPVTPRSPLGADPEITKFRRRTILGLLVILFVVVPALSLIGQYTGTPLMEAHDLNRLGRYLCYAIAALGIDLIWGYAGVLSLCHALFFCLGGYAMAMFLSLPSGGGDVRPEYHNIPQFFFFNNVDSLPVWWRPLGSFPIALFVGLAVPALLAGLIGFFIFRNRVRGVYFSIITQALAWGAFLAFSRNEMLLGGTNGLTNFYKPLTTRPNWILGLYLLTSVALVGVFWLCRRVVRSRFGRVLVAIRDNEPRLFFLGYRADLYKALAFVAAALVAAIGGMLYVPQTGIIAPHDMRVEVSIWMVIWVAVGGRGTLWGAIMGALVAMFTYSSLTSDLPQAWPFIQGGLFLTALAYPGGAGELWSRLEDERQRGFGMGRAVVALGFVELFLIADKLGWFARILPTAVVAGVHVRYLIPFAVVVVLCAGKRAARAAVPLLALAWFIFSEAFGLMPGSFSYLKYLLVLLSIIVYAVGESGVLERLKNRAGRSALAGAVK
ncbi:MAG TPA: urea ABC transporter permease subunit UrtC [Terriglobia bacterium]|nr:urea ABC transporter permease subunit UrtC [Terriglobia bacterium]